MSKFENDNKLIKVNGDIKFKLLDCILSDALTSTGIIPSLVVKRNSIIPKSKMQLFGTTFRI